MKYLIKQRLRENLIEAKMGLNDVKDFILIKRDNLFLLYNPINEKPIGYISIGLTKDNVYSVYGAYANDGYGPLLYEIAMTYVFPNGITMSDEASTSGDALIVWDKFRLRNDVKKDQIKRSKKTEKEMDLINGCDGNTDCLNWVKQILVLHHMKFTYSFGKRILNQMVNKGDNFLSSNPNLDIQGMIYDLEG